MPQTNFQPAPTSELARAFTPRYSILQLPFLVLLSAVLLTLTAGCQAGADNNNAGATTADILDRGIDAHGGLDKWRSFRSLTYDLERGESTERHVIDLRKRHVRVEAANYTIGFDGTDVWVQPELESYSGDPRFYSSLFFYFFSTPFVLADPGTNREPLPSREIDGTTYDAMRIGFDDGVGDSPKDYYLPHFNRETARMDLLLYTATFRSQEVSTRYNAQKIEEWQEVDGLVVPAVMASYVWDNDADSLGVRRSGVRFSNVSFGMNEPDAALFVVPDGAEIAAPASDS